jgi:hypothetical protein
VGPFKSGSTNQVVQSLERTAFASRSVDDALSKGAPDSPDVRNSHANREVPVASVLGGFVGFTAGQTGEQGCCCGEGTNHALSRR